MEINADFQELLSIFKEEGVRYLVVGGYAVMRYTEPRYTKDIDIWVDPAEDNATLVFRALARFGAPLSDVTVKDFMDPGTVYQVGVDPVRIDILKALPGLTFHQAWARRVESRLGDEIAFVISRDDLITTKLATGRRQDRADARALSKTRQ